MTACDPQPDMATITVGIPLCNSGPATLAALEDVVQQTLQPSRVILSDNASDDSTADYMRRIPEGIGWLTRRHLRKRLNAFAHFRSLLATCNTDYFVWHAHDDRWNNDFLAECVTKLRKSPEAVFARPTVVFDQTPRAAGQRVARVLIRQEDHSSVQTYLRTVTHNSAFYGVFRTAILKQAFRTDDTFWGADVLVIARLLARGTCAPAPNAIISRGVQGESSRKWTNLGQYNPSGIGRLIPLAPLSLRLLSDLTQAREPRVFATLISRNFRAACSLSLRKALTCYQ